ncbi:MAG: M20/M25/M40 family metallo-hydrolase [Planctomycetes bacterium]|nr:M20/M25/M40 family metallo-hydrolase [Planctomycetota bacterium]
MIDTLAALIACRSENPPARCDAVCRLARDLLAVHRPDELRFVRTAPQRGFVIARWGRRPRFLINVHLDTVPAGDGWRGDPFTLRRVGRRLYGRGTCDTKGAAAALFAALGTVRPRELAVLFNSDEEHGFADSMRAFLASRWMDGVKDAVVCEPTGLAVATTHRGIQNFEIEVRGKSAHGSAPELGVNAVARAAVLVVGLGQLQHELLATEVGGLRGSLINVGVIAGGVKANIVPDRCAVTLGCRPLPGVNDLARRIRHQVHKLAPGSKVTRGFAGPALGASETCRPARLLRAAGAGPIVGVNFWSEAALLAQAGIRSVVFGPGSIRQAHAADEFVPVAELERARTVFTRLMEML